MDGGAWKAEVHGVAILRCSPVGGHGEGACMRCCLPRVHSGTTHVNAPPGTQHRTWCGAVAGAVGAPDITCHELRSMINDPNCSF